MRIPKKRRSATAAEFWSAMRAGDERRRASDERLDRLFAEVAQQQKEIAQRQEETDRIIKETALQMEETDRKISKLGDRFGEAVEYMVKPNLVEKFRELGFLFTKIYTETAIKDETNNIKAEVDLTLEDGDKVMLVEVKSKPSIKDIKEHTERMGKVRRHADLHEDRRKYLGAVAGLVMKENVQEYALRNGFYVIEPSGDTFNIIEPKGEYRIREW
jgi:hypothetical protein